MSYGYRTRVRQTQYLWDSLTEEEKQRPMEWCPVSDELIREQYPGQNVDAVIAKMSGDEFLSFFKAVMLRFRNRKKKKQLAEREQEQEEEEEQTEEVNDQTERELEA